MASNSTSKAGKLGNVLKSTVAKAPIRLPKGKVNTASLKPAGDEQPIAILRARVVGLNDIPAKDKNGFSDPYVVASLLGQRFQTPTLKKTLNPVYPPDKSTFEFPIYASLLDQVHGLELIVWDADMIGDDYIGEATVKVEDWFKAGAGYDSPSNEARIHDPHCHQGFLHQVPDFDGLYKEILQRRSLGQPTLTSAPPTEGVGTVRLDRGGAQHNFDQDGFDSDVEEETSALSNQAPVSTTSTAEPPAQQSEPENIVGVIMLEVHGAEDLPKIKNATRISYDMDPFCVISFSRRVFRTRVIRHSLSPVWDEKLVFHARRAETHFNVAFSINDWDALGNNDRICETSLDLKELLVDVPLPGPNGLYPPSVADDTQLKSFRLKLTGDPSAAWQGKQDPYLTVKAKYQPCDALRQRFWRQYLKQYDADETNTWSKLEITSMLDSLGSTLSHPTIDNLFTSRGKNGGDDLTLDEAVRSLEEQLLRPARRKTLASFLQRDTPQDPPAEGLKYSGPTHTAGAVDPITVSDKGQKPLDEAAGLKDDDDSITGSGDEDDYQDTTKERLINLHACPMCHQQDLVKKSDIDAITHMALCASGDWGRVDRMITDNYVTADQASRGWYIRVLSKFSSGAYTIGANSANIIVQNRMTGQLEEEKMQIFVRLGIRLLYKGAKGQMEGARAKNLLKSLSVKQGVKYDDPASAAEIPAFVEFHRLDMNECLDPIGSFRTFNEFFYRKLKADARPVAEPNDPSVVVSAADCRLLTFDTVQEAQKIWIKGKEFTLEKLFGPGYEADAKACVGGALSIFRLAPQDYHRYHSPVDGTVGKMTYIPGEYYTVNPQAIRTKLDVYGDNARTIAPIDSPVFGRVMMVCVGAMMVGSINMTVKEGQRVARGEELGYFAFGGSTCVMVVPKGAPVQWDEDLRANSKQPLETLVRVGMRLGKLSRP
ncbi:phosphatidylserine decarboxylase-domain-containing protein [Auriculariales sp. MPI-PUGE-AT-0066]|nr:phosphatidylserine decarboxylase-domain-containing protein [Auriculariales sp. MPI-PUGE-AT-0066]